MMHKQVFKCLDYIDTPLKSKLNKLIQVVVSFLKRLTYFLFLKLMIRLTIRKIANTQIKTCIWINLISKETLTQLENNA